MRVLVACEYSGRVREAFRALGHDVWSCDLEPAEDNGVKHYQGELRHFLSSPAAWPGFDMMIAHPPCTRLTNAGVRWLHKPPRGRTVKEMWDRLRVLPVAPQPANPAQGAGEPRHAPARQHAPWKRQAPCGAATLVRRQGFQGNGL